MVYYLVYELIYGPIFYIGMIVALGVIFWLIQKTMLSTKKSTSNQTDRLCWMLNISDYVNMFAIPIVLKSQAPYTNNIIQYWKEQLYS